MKILVLGSAGGVPPCRCDGTPCCDVDDAAGTPVCTQASIAVSSDGARWVLLNAPRGLGARLRAESARQDGAGETPIAAVVLLDAHIDHVSGLLALRDGAPIELHCTPCVFEDLTSGLPILPLLQHYCGVRWHLLPVAGERSSAAFVIDAEPGLRFLALAIEGTGPSYSPHRHDPGAGDHIGLVIEDVATGQRLLYAPALAQRGAEARAELLDATELLLDSVV